MESNKVKILFAGDFCSLAPQQLKMGDSLKNLLQSCDIKFLNFEGPLQIGELHTAGDHFLRQSNYSPAWCMEHGFNLIGLANNHAYDFGQQGLVASQKSFGNVITLGSGYWDDAYAVRYVEKNGLRLGFFAATSADLSALKDCWSDDKKIGCAWINHNSVTEIIRNAKKQCDYLFVLPHAGVEFMIVPLPEWRSRYYELIDAGADAIIASHPHVVQGWELYHNKPIFYSLGNFVFEKIAHDKPNYWDNGLLVCLEITKYELTFNIQATTLGDHLIDIDHADSTKQRLRTLCDILSNENRYMAIVNESVLYFYRKYEGWLLDGFQAAVYRPFTLRILYRLLRKMIKGGMTKRSALHQLREESTRWTLTRALKIMSKTDL